MIENFSPDVIQMMDVTDTKEQRNLDTHSRYYVYGLLDPSTLQVFYVGKGCGNRVFAHAKNAWKDYDNDMKGTEDDDSLKISTIKDIIEQGKQVIAMIYRWGLTESEAFAVEATLIDYIPGLTNIQSGHDADHGMILAEDLQNTLIVPEYEEPEENYVIIKTKQKYKNARGSIYEATRKYWKMKLEKAQEYHYVVSAVQGIVKEVYEVTKWYRSEDEGETDRIEFVGERTCNPNMRKLIGKRLPAQYTKKGLANPFLYINNKSNKGN